MSFETAGREKDGVMLFATERKGVVSLATGNSRERAMLFAEEGK